MIQVKRVYDPHSPEDGFRVLADRLWSPGVTRETARPDLRLKEIAPITGLEEMVCSRPGKVGSVRREI